MFLDSRVFQIPVVPVGGPQQPLYASGGVTNEERHSKCSQQMGKLEFELELGNPSPAFIEQGTRST